MGKDMRPIIFKGGGTCGKVEGIRGLYRDTNGRWYVRKSINGVDRQLTIESLNKKPTFSELERKAETALKRLSKAMEKKNHSGVDQTTETKTSAKKEETYKRNLEHFFDLYKSSNVTHEVWLRRRREMEGFWFSATDDQTVNEHNLVLLSTKLKELDAEGKKYGRDVWNHIKSIFNKAIEMKIHAGINPCRGDNQPKKRAVAQPKDQITMQESAKILAYMEQNEEDIKAHYSDLDSFRDGERAILEIKSFFYLTTLGMRASSAYLFDAKDLQEMDSGDFRYHVDNNKIGEVMEVSQILPAFFCKMLFSLENFTIRKPVLLKVVNDIIKQVLKKDVTQKHLRKGFITECDTVGLKPELLTHKPDNVKDKNYLCNLQDKADQTSKWWNRSWFEAYQTELAALSTKEPIPDQPQPDQPQPKQRETKSDFLEWQETVNAYLKQLEAERIREQDDLTSSLESLQKHLHSYDE